jgi:cysteine desulfurase / selenocysteine lyase
MKPVTLEKAQQATRDADQDGGFDLEGVRADFPGLHQTVHGNPLAYLDNGATSQKPKLVLDAIDRAYRLDCANVHRGIHTLAERATADYEGARKKLQRWINAPSHKEVIYTRGTTEAINLVAQSYLRPRLGPGDEVLISAMEHHANIVPWQLVCEQTGAKVVVAPITRDGELILDEVAKRIGPRTRLVSLVHVSNVLGTINPVREVVALAKAQGVPVLLDGAQAVPHGRIDVQELGCDFYCFSSHKMYGPTGVGILWGKAEHLQAMPPWHGGGDMIRQVTFEGTTFADIPHKFEAGTPHIAGAIGLGAAVDYMAGLDLAGAARHEADLLAYATDQLHRIQGLKILGPLELERKASVISFTLCAVHPHDLATILDRHGVAVRAGHHCAQPLMRFFKVPATARASFAFYNTRDEVDQLVHALGAALEMFS